MKKEPKLDADEQSLPGGERSLFVSAATVVPETNVDSLQPSASHPSLSLPIAPVEESLYELQELVGEGGMGAVYRAKDKPLHRIVAVKVLHEKIASNVDMLRRFLKEAQITAQLEHPAIVPTYHIEKTSDGQTRLAMRLIDGETLESYITREAQGLGREQNFLKGLPDRLELFLRASDAVQYAHDRGVVHRDLKAENIMLGSFRDAYVMDWGLATLKGKSDSFSEYERQAGISEEEVSVQDDPRATRVGDVLGTVAYMAPEQAMGAHEYVDIKSDQFAMGLILQELVTLAPARSGDSFRQVLTSAMQAKREPLPSWTPPGLAAIIARASAAEPESRYSSMSALDRDLRSYLRDEEISVYPDPLIVKAWRYLSKHKLVVSALMLLTIAAMISLAAFDWAREAQREVEAAYLAQQVAEEVSLVAGRALTFDALAKGVEYELSHLAGAVEHVLILPPSQSTSGVRETLKQETTKRDPVSLGYASNVDLQKPSLDFFHKSEAASLDRRRVELLQDDFRNAWIAGLIREGGEELVQREMTYLLTPSGVSLSFPGEVARSKGGDPRTQATYQNAKASSQTLWGVTRASLETSETLVSATRSVYSESDSLLGVIGIDLRFRAFESDLALTQIEGFSDAWLLDAERRVLSHFKGKKIVENAESRFLFPEVIAEVVSSPTSGEVQSRGMRYLYAEIPTLSWTYVVAKTVE